MDEKIVDADWLELDDRQYFTIEEATKILQVEISQIIFWCNKFENLLKIKSIGMFQIFNKEDIRNLETIKDLNVTKGLNTKEILEFLGQHSTALVIKKENELENSIFNFFANIVSTQNDKIDGLIQSQNQFIQMVSKMYSDNSFANNKLLENQDSQNNYIKVLESKLDNLSEIAIEKLDMIEHEFQKRDVEKITNEKQNMETRRILYEINEKEKKKGFLKKLFKKN